MGNQTTCPRSDPLRILIDAAALSPPAPRWLSKWWSDILPGLLEQLDGNEVWVLQRDRAQHKSSESSVHRLAAPAVDRPDLATEDRRLAALCHELAADCFLSSYATSAGGQGRTLLVLPPGRPWSMSGHRKNAAQLASGFLVFSSTGRLTLKRFGIGDGDWIAYARTSGMKQSGHGGFSQAQELAQALVATALHTSEGSALARRTNAELAVQSKAQALRQRSQKCLARSHQRGAGMSPSRLFFGRVLRALRNPAAAARKAFELIVSRLDSR